MVNGILFIIAGLGSIAVYMGLGETGLLDKGHTEKIAAYALVTIPLAFMMTRNVVRNTFIDAQSDSLNRENKKRRRTIINQTLRGIYTIFVFVLVDGRLYGKPRLFKAWK